MNKKYIDKFKLFFKMNGIPPCCENCCSWVSCPCKKRQFLDYGDAEKGFIVLYGDINITSKLQVCENWEPWKLKY